MLGCASNESLLSGLGCASYSSFLLELKQDSHSLFLLIIIFASDESLLLGLGGAAHVVHRIESSRALLLPLLALVFDLPLLVLGCGSRAESAVLEGASRGISLLVLGCGLHRASVSASGCGSPPTVDGASHGILSPVVY